MSPGLLAAWPSGNSELTPTPLRGQTNETEILGGSWVPLEVQGSDVSAIKDDEAVENGRGPGMSDKRFPQH